jgi:hypothetical protein
VPLRLTRSPRDLRGGDGKQQLLRRKRHDPDWGSSKTRAEVTCGRLEGLARSRQPRSGILPDVVGIPPDPLWCSPRNAAEFQRGWLVWQVLSDELCIRHEHSGHRPKGALPGRAANSLALHLPWRVSLDNRPQSRPRLPMRLPDR